MLYSLPTAVHGLHQALHLMHLFLTFPQAKLMALLSELQDFAYLTEPAHLIYVKNSYTLQGLLLITGTEG